jgi:hypothetical protein
MATNLTTIEVRLQANARNFKNQLDKGSQGVEKLRKSTQKVIPTQKTFQERLRNVSGSIAAVQGPLGPVAGRLNAIGAITGRVSGTLLVALGAFTALGVGITKFISAGAKAESQALKLEAILKATGFAAGQTAEDIEELAISIGRNTLASVQGARDAAGILLTFKSISGDTFGEVLKLSQDLAAVGFGSITTAATQLGKALEEPEVGLASLRRVGVSFSESQKEQIKVLSLTGKQAEAQAMILKALKDQVGGAGEGAAGGLAGAFDTLGENITLFFEKAALGKAIVTALTGVINALAFAFGAFIPEEERLPKTIEGLNDALEKQAIVTELAREKLEKLNNEKTRGKGKKLKEAQDELNKSLDAELRIRNALNAIEAEPSFEDKSAKITLETLSKIQRGRNAEIFALGKSRAELRAIADLRKLESALISKLGEGPIARAKINDILSQEREKRLEIAELQTKEIEAFERLESIANGVGGAFETAGKKISDAFVEGKTDLLDFKSILRQIVIDVQKTIIQVLILDRIKKAITGAITGTSTGGLSLGRILQISMGMGGFTTATEGSFASGGTIQAGRPSLVGERGPELFVPRTAGSIVPSSLTPGKMGGGGSVVINQNLNFALGVTNTVRTEIANLLPQIQQSTISAVADAKLRGGKFAKAFGG